MSKRHIIRKAQKRKKRNKQKHYQRIKELRLRMKTVAGDASILHKEVNHGNSPS